MAVRENSKMITLIGVGIYTIGCFTIGKCSEPGVTYLFGCIAIMVGGLVIGFQMGKESVLDKLREESNGTKEE